MLILGIESSCDETAAAIVEDGHLVKSTIIASQIAAHAPYGGVIPELAAREHLRAIRPTVQAALEQAGIQLEQVEGIAVTHTPGLLPALLVGLSYAKGLAAAQSLPLIGVNHLTAHIYGAFIDHRNRLEDPESFPVLALIVSGGHTLLVVIKANGNCEIVGRTIDDAAGEAFDKAARLLELPYPGGPVMDRLAGQGDPNRFTFPRALTGGGGTAVKEGNRFNFSFSGVKTALLYHLKKLSANSVNGQPAKQDLLDTIASYQEAVTGVLAKKLQQAARAYEAKTLVLCGGVACNSRLRTLADQTAEAAKIPLLIAPSRYCTDNAAMIAGLGYRLLKNGEQHTLDLDAVPRMQSLGHLPSFLPHNS